jgi:hypothetical protein
VSAAAHGDDRRHLRHKLQAHAELDWEYGYFGVIGTILLGIPTRRLAMSGRTEGRIFRRKPVPNPLKTL